MKITRMTKGSWGKVRAFFDIEVAGFVMKGFKIMEGINGLFVSYPAIQDKSGEYNDTIYSSKDLRDELNSMAKEHYNRESKQDEAPFIS